MDNAGLMSNKLRYLYRAYRYRWRVDPAEIRFVCKSLEPGQVAADIGCHKGAYTYWMRRRVGPGGAVYAFEPQPKQVAYLREAFAAMRYDNVAIVPMAASSRNGEMTLHVPAGAGKTHAATLEVRSEERGMRSEERGVRGECQKVLESHDLPVAPHPLCVSVTTLDAFFADEPRGPHFLKIDVEGHELAVLQGARQTLETYHPTILVECEARHRADGDVRPAFELLESLGYEGSFFQGQTRRPLKEFDPAVHQPIEVTRAGPLPIGYVNNFAFVKRGQTRSGFNTVG